MESKAIALFNQFPYLNVLYRAFDGEYFFELDDVQAYLIGVGFGGYTVVNRTTPLPTISESEPNPVNSPIWVLINNPNVATGLRYDNVISYTQSSIGNIGTETFAVNRVGAYRVGNYVSVVSRRGATVGMSKYGKITAITGNELTINFLSYEGINNLSADDWDVVLTGKKGDKGDDYTGVGGDIIQNYGGSLLKNGALELATLAGWNGATLDAGFNNLPHSLKVLESAYCTNLVPISIDKLYSIEYWVKNQGNTDNNAGGVALEAYDFTNTKLSETKRVYPQSTYTWISSGSSQFVKKKNYFGGYGTMPFNFKDSTLKVSPYVFKVNGVAIYINALIIREVSLGEPVPYIIPYLPKGQIVYDPTFWDTGIFNGTEVVWDNN